MLPKKNRLTQKKDFDSVFKNGKTVKIDFLIFKLLKNRFNENRFGFIVSKKVSNKSTKRNLIKRRLRMAITGELNNLKTNKSLDIVVVVLPEALNRDFKEMQTATSKFFSKIN
ncbi:MAG: ribonuclease P protein component [Candidatus Staskawiczbacteria bacterium RIFCSPHIGHO2_02_FULL_34_9]|uniref:Ribonuclease P protein component n=1 Tax=Candidatus Staskawiczbacteria bacterium RIFCSPHIGHO2_02_FULL_34_9 TaxID=1802206 RepID=A0A1G2HXM0_9BACT|nr:MAG: ribonuclease P protein component [Candidatus Staskawiczbacteria bacterium RIFCSPHIGHO2_02_FULL_34_9]